MGKPGPDDDGPGTGGLECPWPPSHWNYAPALSFQKDRTFCCCISHPVAFAQHANDGPCHSF
eukprot:7259977-Lingulodinium_polyedra.AAC.1